MSDPVLQLDQVSQVFSSHGKPMRAVDRVSFAIREGETVCLVGESGCGKTTTGKIAAGLRRPTSGQVLFRGRDIWSLNRRDWQEYRSAVQLVHQDPYASLNPAQTVAQILSAPLLRHGLVRNRRHARERVYELLDRVSLSPVEDYYDKFPHQLSGGQRQRLSIARALTVNPSFIVADEAVSMVDVSTRVSLLKTLITLREQLGVGFLFITHDLAIAKFFAWQGQIGVMYLGRMVEFGRTPQIVNQPGHPYTRALLSAVPEADPDLTRNKERIMLASQNIPNLLNLPPACTFHPRCPLFEAGTCDVIEPALTQYEAGQLVACHVTTGRVVAREQVPA
ncbi:MAG TPA: ABC transporter ATP-binding protein [Roseiflexaceae bacterium]|jgi:peptide/nickel transport system ATP-binding protein|nr:ABC transporter ATP-binding protein [Roseiflexaceae bacterium]